MDMSIPVPNHNSYRAAADADAEAFNMEDGLSSAFGPGKPPPLNSIREGGSTCFTA